MGGCRKYSVPIPFVPLRPLIVDLAVTVPIPPLIGITIEFDQAMNQGVLPSDVTFEVTIDGVPAAVNVLAWQDATHLDCQYTGAVPIVSGYIRQLILDTNCVSLLGTYARPQSNVQWFP